MTAHALQTHVSLDTADLAASIAFYRALLGAEPALVRHDYARFDLAEPALVLGLNAVRGGGPAGASGAHGSIEHLGIRFPAPRLLDEARRRLRELGAALEDESGVECCYALLSRSWARDPSGVAWELFVAHEEVREAPGRGGAQGACCEPACCSGARIEP